METSFSKKLKELREEKGLSQRQLANKVLINQANISRWEDGSREPSISGVKVLAKFFDVTTDYLLGVSEEI